MPASGADPASHGLADIVIAVAAGDRAAFARLYGLTNRKLWAVATRILRDRTAAEDVVQEAYVRIWRSAAAFDPARASPITWMSTIVRHCAIDVLRKQQLEPVTGDDDGASLQVAAEDVDPAGELDRARRRAIAYAAIRRMDPAQRRLMLQAYLRAESRESLARGHGLPTGTVKTHLRRSLLALRHTIQCEEARGRSRGGARNDLRENRSPAIATRHRHARA